MKFHISRIIVAIVGISFIQPNLLAQSSHPTSVEGLPFSGTSLTADHQLRQGGFMDGLGDNDFFVQQESADTAEQDATFSDGSEAEGSFGFVPTYGAFSSPQLKGDTYTLPAYANFKLTDRVGMSLNLPMQYTRFRGPGGELEVWNLNLTVGLPIKVIKKVKSSPFSWIVTPHAGAGGYYADDGSSSRTYVGHGGLTSMLGFQNDRVIVSLANQITFFETIDRTGMYEMTPDISQTVWKNGLKISVPFAGRWIVDVYGIHTEFLEDAFLDRYFTVGASIGCHLSRMKKGSYAKMGTYTELAHGYQSIQLQFGTGWKF